MNFKSCIYRIQIHHKRDQHNHFTYSMYYFFLDLNKIVQLRNEFFALDYNRFHIFSFFPEDYLNFLDSSISKKNRKRFSVHSNKKKISYLKKQICDFIYSQYKDNSIKKIDRIFFLGNIRTLGFHYNPVCFFYCYCQNKLQYIVAQVTNTYREQKGYVIPVKNNHQKGHVRTHKNFYVSPFIKMDSVFIFDMPEPAENLLIKITAEQDKKKVLVATLLGKSKKLTNAQIFFCLLSYPLLPLQILYWIHWQALKLWLRKIKYYSKPTKE